jgi:hypothetical protein
LAREGLPVRLRHRDPRRYGVPIRKNMEERYNIYVKSMAELGLPYVDFDTWLNR